jgi:hypothetical protein
LEDEYSQISVTESLKILKLDTAWQSSESVMIVKPKLKIPGFLRIWNSNRCGLSLYEKVIEIKWIVHAFAFPYFLHLSSLLCPDSQIEEIFG